MTTHRVLVVDDEAFVLTALEISLVHAGYHVQIACNAEEALVQFQQSAEAFDVVVTDLQMPGMSGQELARQLLLLRPDVRIVFMSGDPDNQPLPSRVGASNSLFFEKPFV